MTFDATQHPRATDGKFAEKQGEAAEISLSESPRAVDGDRPQAPEIVLNGGRFVWTEEDHEYMLPGGRPSYDPAARRNEAIAALEGLGTPLTNEYTLRDPLVIAAERQGIAGVVLSTRFGGDGEMLDYHRIRLARSGAEGIETGDFTVFTLNNETPSVRGSLRQVISNAPFLTDSERAENSVGFEALYSSSDNVERYEALTSAAVVAADGESEVVPVRDVVPGTIVIAPTARGDRIPGIVNWTRDSPGGTEINYLDGRTIEVGDDDDVLVYG